MISQVSVYSPGSCQNISNPSFTSIHRAKYFVKWDDGYYYRPASDEVVRKLQRSIITMLNKGKSDSGKQPSAADKLRQRLVDFFMRKDVDYAQNPVARSFYPLGGNSDSFVITGTNIHLVDEAAKPIGRVWRKTNGKADILACDYGMSSDMARRQAAASSEVELADAKRDYFDTVMRKINNILANKNPKDSVFSAFFEPRKNGSKVTYELVDAKFGG